MFIKGQSGNPNGRPMGSKNLFTADELEIAIKEVSEEKKANIFKHFIERALISDAVLIALMRKILPDKAEPLVNNNNLINIRRTPDQNAHINFDPEEIARIRKEWKDHREQIHRAMPELITGVGLPDEIRKAINAEVAKEKELLISTIKPEMTKDEVLKVIGYPDFLSEENGLDIWYFREINKENMTCRNIWVIFENSKCIKADIYGFVP